MRMEGEEYKFLRHRCRQLQHHLLFPPRCPGSQDPTIRLEHLQEYILQGEEYLHQVGDIAYSPWLDDTR